MMLSPKILLIVLLLLASCSRIDSNVSVEGVYQSVSESEWDLTVSIFSGGKAQIKLENWDVGKYDKRDVKIVAGSWSLDNNNIVLRYEGITDILHYTDNLPLNELGLEGGAPGLMQVPPIERKSMIHGIKLWKEPHKFYSK